MSDEKGIILVKYTAPWCGPCHAMEPTLKEFSRLHPEVRIERVNIDTDKGGKRADEENVKAVPTMILYVNGKKCWRAAQVVGLKALENALTRSTQQKE